MKALPHPANWVLAALLALGGCSEVSRSSVGLTDDRHASAWKTTGALRQSPERRRRAQRGDTLSLPTEVLQRFLPARIAGFAPAGPPRSAAVQLGGISYSTCEQRYRRGTQVLKVQVVDYNGAVALYDGATALMSTDFLQENDEQLTRGCDLGVPGVRGFETVQKMEHRASVALGVGERFFVSVESTGQENTQLVKSVARQLNLRGLAAL